MLNPDGRLWIDRLAGGLVDTGQRLSASDGERIVRLVAHHVGAEVHPGSPRVSAELPETGERFEGLLLGRGRAGSRSANPQSPCSPRLRCRRHAAGAGRDAMAAAIVTTFFAGGTLTGKTTTNALLWVGRPPMRRADKIPANCNVGAELWRSAPDGVALALRSVRSRCGCVPRIPIGEEAEALDLPRPWGNQPRRPAPSAGYHRACRMEQLIQEAVGRSCAIADNPVHRRVGRPRIRSAVAELPRSISVLRRLRPHAAIGEPRFRRIHRGVAGHAATASVPAWAPVQQPWEQPAQSDPAPIRPGRCISA